MALEKMVSFMAPIPMAKQARLMAAAQEITRSELIRRAVAAYLSQAETMVEVKTRNGEKSGERPGYSRV